ncbi:MAG: hypothetical protein ABI983_06335 [Acidobacteriota bacterium]
MDSLLAAFLSAPSGPAADTQLDELLLQHAPLIRRVIGRRLGWSSADIDDLSAQVTLQLLVRLRQERADSTLDGIEALTNYIATVARHSCDHHLRAIYPLRWRLRNRILYALEHDGRLAAWQGADGGWICGLAGWQSRPRADAAPPIGQLSGVPTDDVRALLRRMLDLSGAPLDLATVVEAAADVWNIPRRPLADKADLEGLAHAGPRADEVLDQRDRLARVWAEVMDLPLRQRHALLLNLRDGAASLFLTSGVTTLRDVAAALEMPIEEFASLWNDLPLADNAIAERLDCTRQQVINLRMAARKRLGHRLLVAC